MRAGILALLGVCLAAALAEAALPGDGQKGTKKAFHFLVALAVLLLILRPFLGALAELPENLPENVMSEIGTEDYGQIFSRAVSEGSEPVLRQGICDYLSRNFGIGQENAEIGIVFAADGQLSLITVRLSGKALVCDPAAVAAGLSTEFNCPAEVR